jgi:hypothetical protein
LVIYWVLKQDGQIEVAAAEEKAGVVEPGKAQEKKEEGMQKRKRKEIAFIKRQQQDETRLLEPEIFRMQLGLPHLSLSPVHQFKTR